MRKLFPQTPALLAPSSPHIVDEVTLIILSKLHNRPPNTPSAALMFSPEQFVLSNIFHTLLLSLLCDVLEFTHPLKDTWVVSGLGGVLQIKL